MGGYAPPPLPIMPSNAGQPRATGMLAQGGKSSTMDPSGAINAFMTNYITMKEQVKQQNRQKFLEGVQMASQGIPVDNEKLMKAAKKGGLDFLPTEASQMPPQQPQQMSPSDPGGVGGWQSLPGGGSASVQAPAQQPPPQQAPQQPSLLNRIGQGLGITSPPVSNQSPMGQWLTQLSQAGQQGGGLVGQVARGGALQELMDHMAKVGLDVKGMSYQQEMNVFNMMKTATMGPPGKDQDDARENLTRMGVLTGRLPIDEFTEAMRRIDPTLSPDEVDKGAASAFMYGKMGGPQMKLAMMQMGKDMLPYMPNNRMDLAMKYINDVFTKGGSDIVPQMGADQYKQYMDGVKTLMDAYPTAPANLVNAAATAKMTNNTDMTNQLMDVVSKFPRSGTVDYKKHQETLGYDYATLAQKTQNEAGLLNLGVATQLGMRNQQAYDNWWKLANDPNATGDQVRAAFQGMMNAKDKDQAITLNYRGKEIPLGDSDVKVLQNWRPTWPQGKPYLTPGEMNDEELKGFVGAPQQPGLSAQVANAANPLSVIQKWAQTNINTPDGPQKVQAIQSLVITLARVPPAARQSILDNMQAPKEIKDVVAQALKAMPGSPTSIAGQIDPNSLPPSK